MAVLAFVLVARVAISQAVVSPVNLPYPASGQHSTSISCGTDAWLQNMRLNPSFRFAEEKMNEEILRGNGLLSEDTLVLPVVFHIISDNPNAVTDLFVQKGLADLNDAFANSGNWFGVNGTDTRIRFKLAQKDPDGGNTTGITRVQTHWGSDINREIEDAKMKDVAEWDPKRYINIWIVKNLQFETFAEFSCGVWTRGSINGYATLPPGGSKTDGIVITKFGYLFIHEMGHFLGLYHTFEGGCKNNNCAVDGDRVCDTQPDGTSRSSVACNDPLNSCNTDTLSQHSNGFFTTDVPDPIENLMDMGNEGCHRSFTKGQADRMHTTIITQRPGLLATNTALQCNDDVFASFLSDIQEVKAGDKIQFTNTSKGATAYQWLLNGVLIDSAEHFGHTFHLTGKHKVTLKAIKNSTCFASHSVFINVNCGVTARFYPNKQKIASKENIFQDTILFTNTSFGATQYQWMIGNDKGLQEQMVSNETNLAYMFATPAKYSVRLIASTGSCTKVTLTQYFDVLDPTADATIYVNAVNCYEETKAKVEFYICNSGYDTLAANLPVSFYDGNPALPGTKKIGSTFYTTAPVLGKCCSGLYTVMLDVGYRGLDQLYVVVNDNGTQAPPELPNTSIIESNYTNNVQMVQNFGFKAVPVPASVSMEPGDTIKLSAYGRPTETENFRWIAADRLSCTQCRETEYIADTTPFLIRQVIGVSEFNCIDTAQVRISVPPYHDFRVRIGSAECAAGDSMQVMFTLFNDFKRGILPTGLTVRFYNGNPLTENAKWLPPAFVLKDTIAQKEYDFSARIKGSTTGKLFALVNDDSGAPPIIFPNSFLLEKAYNNNLNMLDYEPETIHLIHQDTIIMRGTGFYPTIKNSLASNGTVTWKKGVGYTISCEQCQTPFVSITQPSMVPVSAVNTFGCVINGKLNIRMLPPDFTLQVLNTSCINNTTTKVDFSICMNNGYDSVWKNIPVSFYEGNPTVHGARLLQTVFVTPSLVPGSCASYSHQINTPTANYLYVVVNDSGNAATSGPDPVFPETNFINNIVHAANFKRFNVRVEPNDTTIERASSATLFAVADGGTLRLPVWQSNPFLSCTSCFSPVVTPNYTDKYMVTGSNENQCTDTGWVTVRTVTLGEVYVPSGFTPNQDGLNDILYVMANGNIKIIKDFYVFSRWGEKIFEVHNVAPNNPLYGWKGFIKGQPAASGAYLYQVVAEFTDGKTKHFKGAITLIR